MSFPERPRDLLRKYCLPILRESTCERGLEPSYSSLLFALTASRPERPKEWSHPSRAPIYWAHCRPRELRRALPCKGRLRRLSCQTSHLHCLAQSPKTRRE